MSSLPGPLLSGANAGLIADLYVRFLADPAAIDPGWRALFADLGDDARAVMAEFGGANWSLVAPAAAGNGARGNGADAATAKANGAAVARTAAVSVAAVSGAATADADALRRATQDSIRALMLIRAHRVRGHLAADLDPLGLAPRPNSPELDPGFYGFGPGDWDRPIYIDGFLGLQSATLRQLTEKLKATYCSKIGVEYMHIQDPEQKNWIQERIESVDNKTDFTERGRRAILERLTAAEIFEQFLHRKYVGTKRFGLDGGESLIPALEQVMKRGGQLGLQEIVLGMAHRGRLNVLANVMGKPFQAIFSEFQGLSAHPEDVQGSGDVKYHLGTSSDRDFDGTVVHLSLSPNPSHLEAVNPVVLGRVRAKQAQRGDHDRVQVMPVLIHGDAAFAGQGIVPESLMLSELKGYRVGGCLHFIVNNQIGFTTAPSYSRSGPYPTDVAKSIQAPIFHVNGDDPEAVVHVARIATEFRQKFHKDVVVDIFCYRRYGHNEGDEPAFTQPIMYRTIGQRRPTRALYGERLVAEGLLAADEPQALVESFTKRLEAEFESAVSFRPNKADWLEGRWAGLGTAPADARRGETAVSLDQLRRVGLALTRVPDGFNVNAKIARQLEQKRQMIETGEGLDWATAEALAFGTLVAEGVPVRLSGQDSGRGTFSQRHAVLHDQETEERYVPLNGIDAAQASFEVHDSPLSEFAVLGFEYGFSLAEPRALVLWEAQFGDFANGAQVIFDQFISSGESKWLRMSGLVMLLPHGYEGQGPEHSSARLERWLQMCGEDNWQVCNITTPANYFHVLRRQVHRNFRKPLIVMTPKSLLRLKAATSPLAMLSDGQTFHRVLHESGVDLVPDAEIRRVVLCSGKVYYDLAQERQTRGVRDVAIVRLEQLYPFPTEPLADELRRYPRADIVWCQEEPENMGAWHFADRRIEAVLKAIGHATARPVYAGRPEAAAPATGLLRRHNREQAALLDAALTV